MSGKDQHYNPYQNQYFSLYKGLVHDNKDPLKKGRVQVKCTSIFGDSPYEYWAEPKGMFTGNKTGLFLIPKPGDLVWITFENGDCRYPVWEYGPYQDNGAIADLYDSDGNPSRMVLQTTSGHRIVLDDKDEFIQIKDKFGNYFQLDNYGISMVTDKKISEGSFQGSAEPAVLGDKNAEVHDDHLQASINHIHNSALGPTSTPVNIAEFTAAKAKVPSTKSNKVNLD